MLGRVLPALSASAATALVLLVMAGGGTAAVGPAQHAASAAVPAAGLVVQTGRRNYAGPHCPGRGWTCTTATRVLQSGDENRFECAPLGSVVSKSNADGMQSCEIMQNNPTGRNSARCIENASSPTVVQVCTITQTGIANTATVEQVAASGGATQSASQTATVTQNGATARNVLLLRQHVNQTPGGGDDDNDNGDDEGADASAPTTGTVMQDAWERADVVQVASGNGSNSAVLAQDEHQHAVGGATQLQNTGASPLGDCYPFFAPTSPNICANVSQTAVNGDNLAGLGQATAQKASTKAVGVQQQGTPTGGMDGRIHQATGPTGHNLDHADQNKVQHESGAAGSSQTQYDPMFCCGAGSQTGGANNREAIDQAVAQQASETDALQESDLTGESLTPNGTCNVTQRATNNSDTTTNADTVTPCPFLILETSCSNDVEEGGCIAFPPITTPPGCEFSCGAAPGGIVGRRETG